MKSSFFLFLIISLQFTQQVNFWPLIKGKWYVAIENDNLIRYKRTPYSLHNLNFISKDSCELSQMQADDVYKKFRYKWNSHIDTLRIYLISDTLSFKVKNATATDLDLQPIIPKAL
jgi:hypothetical protein